MKKIPQNRITQVQPHQYVPYDTLCDCPAFGDILIRCHRYQIMVEYTQVPKSIDNYTNEYGQRPEQFIDFCLNYCREACKDIWSYRDDETRSIDCDIDYMDDDTSIAKIIRWHFLFSSEKDQQHFISKFLVVHKLSS
jgi:hypothetical protein